MARKKKMLTTTYGEIIPTDATTVKQYSWKNVEEAPKYSLQFIVLKDSREDHADNMRAIVVVRDSFVKKIQIGVGITRKEIEDLWMLLGEVGEF